MAAHLLAAEAQKMGFHSPDLKVAVLTAEPVKPETLQVVSEGLGVHALAEYGCVECGFIAGSDSDGQLQIREEHALLETIPRQDGRYDIVVTVLNNPSFPLIRYGIGDVTDRPIEKPTHGFARIQHIEGRAFDFIVTQKGSVLHGQIFEDTLDRYPGIRRWRVTQAGDGNVRVLLEYPERKTGSLATHLRDRFVPLMEGYDVAVDVVDAIPAGRSGKHRTIVSELSKTLATVSDAKAHSGS